MIHYGKTTHGDLEITVSAEEVGDVHTLLFSSGLLPRRAFGALQKYIEDNFAEELETYRRRMTAQIPRKEDGVC